MNIRSKFLMSDGTAWPIGTPVRFHPITPLGAPLTQSVETAPGAPQSGVIVDDVGNLIRTSDLVITVQNFSGTLEARFDLVSADYIVYIQEIKTFQITVPTVAHVRGYYFLQELITALF